MSTSLSRVENLERIQALKRGLKVAQEMIMAGLGFSRPIPSTPEPEGRR